MIINGEEIQFFVDVNDFRQVQAADAKALGCEAYITRATKGNYLTNPLYASQVAIADAAQPWPFLSYHTLVPAAMAPIESQVRHFHNTVRYHLANTGIQQKCMLNVERTSEGYQPTWNDVVQFITIASAAPFNLDFRILYLARWYHQVMGSPDMRPLFNTFPNLRLTNAHYARDGAGVPAVGTPAMIYPLHDSTAWLPIGNVSPTFLQFTDRSSMSGTTVDCNAFRGTRTELFNHLGWITMANLPPTPPIVTASANSAKPGDIITLTASSSDPDVRLVTVYVSASNQTDNSSSMEVPVEITVTDTIVYHARTTDPNITIEPVPGQPGQFRVMI